MSINPSIFLNQNVALIRAIKILLKTEQLLRTVGTTHYFEKFFTFPMVQYFLDSDY